MNDRPRFSSAARPVADAPVDALLGRVEDLAKDWAIALISALPLARIGEVSLDELAIEMPRVCEAVVRALSSEDDLRRLVGLTRGADRPPELGADDSADAALAHAIGRLGRWAGARDAGREILALESLREVIWEAAIQECGGTPHPRLIGDLSSRLAHVCMCLAAIVVTASVPRRTPAIGSDRVSAQAQPSGSGRSTGQTRSRGPDRSSGASDPGESRRSSGQSRSAVPVQGQPSGQAQPHGSERSAGQVRSAAPASGPRAPRASAEPVPPEAAHRFEDRMSGIVMSSYSSGREAMRAIGGRGQGGESMRSPDGSRPVVIDELDAGSGEMPATVSRPQRSKEIGGEEGWGEPSARRDEGGDEDPHDTYAGSETGPSSRPSIEIRDLRGEGPGAWLGPIRARLSDQGDGHEQFAVLLIEMLNTGERTLRSSGEHLARVLGRVCGAIGDELGAGDLLRREGPGRFWVVTGRSDRESARSLGERLGRAASHVAASESAGGLEVAIGCSLFPDDGREPAALAANADVEVGRIRDRRLRLAAEDQPADAPPV